jgi:hypothetical protein
MPMSDELLDKIDRDIESGDWNNPTYNTDFQRTLEERIAEPWATDEQRTQYRDRLAKLRALQKGTLGPLGGSTWR